MDNIQERFNLSDEQLQILRPGSLSVVACPGAGKTRAIVARFWQSSQELDRGVALLSFTNRAVHEAMQRFGSSPELLRSPNFVGTFDAFLHRYIVTPSVTKSLGRAPVYFPSWDDYPGAPGVRSWKVKYGSGIRLSSFSLTPEGISLPIESLRGTERAYFQSVEKANDVRGLLDRAGKTLNDLFNSGILDSSSARYLALQALSGAPGAELAEKLATRFQEIIVDEFQDCDSNEHEILKLLMAQGTRLVVVSDPDQSIYEFRGDSPGAFDASRTGNSIQDVEFTVNFRSTAPICTAITSLRGGGRPVVIPSTSPPEGPDQVFVISGTPQFQRSQFCVLLDEQGILTSHSVVIGHKRQEAMRIAGGASTESTGNAKCDVVARACTYLSSSRALPRERADALRRLERVILESFDWPPILATATSAVQLAALGRSSEWLRRTAAGLYQTVLVVDDLDHFSKTVRAYLARELQGHSVATIDLSRNFVKPSAESWDLLTLDADVTDARLPFGSIHSAKGSEHPAVMVAISTTAYDGKHAVNDWERSAESEARRVLYVGASRAQRLLAFAVPLNRRDQFTSILGRDSVPFLLIDESDSPENASGLARQAG